MDGTGHVTFELPDHLFCDRNSMLRPFSVSIQGFNRFDEVTGAISPSARSLFCVFRFSV